MQVGTVYSVLHRLNQEQASVNAPSDLAAVFLLWKVAYQISELPLVDL